MSNIYLKAKKKNETTNYESNKTIFKLKDRDKILSKSNIEILDHHAKFKVIAGAKDTSKTFFVKGQEIALCGENDDFSTLDLRKYQKDAIANLSGSWFKFLNYVKLHTDLDVHDYELTGTGKLVKMPLDHKKKKRYINKNILPGSVMASFDNQNGLSGIEVPGSGTFVIVHVDEPVLKDDEKKLPTKKEWDSAIETIDDSVSRHRRSYRLLHPGVEVPKLQWYFTLNPWDNHPVVDALNEYFPEQEFIDFFLGVKVDIDTINKDWLDEHWASIKKSLIKNHTKGKYVKETDTLYVRRTKLANPEIYGQDEESKRAIKALMQKIRMALLMKDKFQLTRYLGLQYDGSSNKSWTYNINVFDDRTPEELIKIGYKPVGVSTAWDIDVNRQMTGAFSILMKNSMLNSYKAALLPLEKIKAHGSGTHGEKNDLYIKQIADKSQSVILDFYKKIGYNLFDSKQRYFWVDENKGFYLNEIRKQKSIEGIYRSFGKAKKHGTYGIIERQDYVQTSLDNKFLIPGPNNELYKKRLKECVNAVGTKKRKTSGNSNKLDEIDTVEYAIYPWRGKAYFNKGD